MTSAMFAAMTTREYGDGVVTDEEVLGIELADVPDLGEGDIRRRSGIHT